METAAVTPILIPVEQEEFWMRIRVIIKEELMARERERPGKTWYNTEGLAYKPLYKIVEVCGMFNVSRPTIYDWIRHGKLKPYKVRSRLYFLHRDIQAMLEG